MNKKRILIILTILLSLTVIYLLSQEFVLKRETEGPKEEGVLLHEPTGAEVEVLSEDEESEDWKLYQNVEEGHFNFSLLLPSYFEPQLEFDMEGELATMQTFKYQRALEETEYTGAPTAFITVGRYENNPQTDEAFKAYVEEEYRFNSLLDEYVSLNPYPESQFTYELKTPGSSRVRYFMLSEDKSEIYTLLFAFTNDIYDSDIREILNSFKPLTREEAEAGLSREEIYNASYNLHGDNHYYPDGGESLCPQFKDGKCSAAVYAGKLPETPDGSLTMNIISEWPFEYSDVDYDGDLDAFVYLSSWQDPFSRPSEHVVLIMNDKGKPVFADAEYLYPVEVVKSSNAHNNVLAIHGHSSYPSDANCCASKDEMVIYTVTDRKLNRILQFDIGHSNEEYRRRSEAKRAEFLDSF